MTNNRFAFATLALKGYSVKLQTADFRWHEGIFDSMTPDGSVTMRWVKPMQPEAASAAERAAQQAARPLPHKVFLNGEVMQLLCRSVGLSAEDVGPKLADDGTGVGTDAAIGRGRGGAVGRRLERWEAPVDADVGGLGLEDDDGGHWDQFEANKRLFNVTTTYREDLYSTKYDPSKSKYSEDEARRIEQEILREARNAGNVHIREERGLGVDDSGVSEEDRFSAVARRASAAGSLPSPRAPAPIGVDGSRSQLRGAWAQAALGSSSLLPAPPSPVNGAPSASPSLGGASTSSLASRSIPIPINPRAEANRVRAALTAGAAKSKSTSPYGTPKDTLAGSPLVRDPKGLVALDLEPGRGVPTAPDIRKEFGNWKKQNKDGLATSVGSTSSDGTQRSLANSARGASSSGALANMAAPATATGFVAPSNMPHAPGQASPVANGSAASEPAALPAAATPPGPQNGVAPGSEDTASPSKPASKLNPNAKPFVFNPKAASFVPGGGASSSGAAAFVPKGPGGPGTEPASLVAAPGALGVQLGRPLGVDRTLSSSSAGSSSFALGQAGQSHGRGRRSHQQPLPQPQQQQASSQAPAYQQPTAQQQGPAEGPGGMLVPGALPGGPVSHMGQPYMPGLSYVGMPGFMTAQGYHMGSLPAMMPGAAPQGVFVANGAPMRPGMMPFMMAGYPPHGMLVGSPGAAVGMPGRPVMMMGPSGPVLVGPGGSQGMSPGMMTGEQQYDEAL